MKLEASEHMHKAVINGYQERISNHSADLTYQQWTLYWMCRWVIVGEFDPDSYYHTLTDGKPDNWLDKQWKKTPASKTHKMEITIPWDKVFDPEDK